MINIILIFSLVAALLMETTSWSLRSFSKAEFKGMFISKTNMYLYGSRLFLLFYTAGLSYLVDKGSSVFDLILLISISYTISSIIHCCIFNNKFHNRFCNLIMRILFIPKYAISSGSTSKHRNKKLASFTLISALIFSCAMAVPYVSAALFPEYRMTLGALGQIINSLGTILLLFLVDPILYKHMDNNQLKENLHGYYVGRFLGFLLGGSVLFIIAMNIREIGL